MDPTKFPQSTSMQTIRLHAVDLAIHSFKYPGRGKQRSCFNMAALIDHCMRKNWRYGWNACAAFCLSFPDGERLEASIVGGLRVKV